MYMYAPVLANTVVSHGHLNIHATCNFGPHGCLSGIKIPCVCIEAATVTPTTHFCIQCCNREWSGSVQDDPRTCIGGGEEKCNIIIDLMYPLSNTIILINLYVYLYTPHCLWVHELKILFSRQLRVQSTPWCWSSGRARSDQTQSQRGSGSLGHPWGSGSQPSAPIIIFIDYGILTPIMV